MWNCRYSILHHPQQLKPHDRLPIWCVLVEPMEGLPSFCLSRLSHRRSPTFKTSLVSDTIVRKGAVLRQLMRERPKSSSTEVHIKQTLLSVFYPLTNYTCSVSDSYRKVKGFLRKNSEVVWFFAEAPQSKNHTTLCFFIPFLSVSENTTKYHQVPYSFR